MTSIGRKLALNKRSAQHMEQINLTMSRSGVAGSPMKKQTPCNDDDAIPCSTLNTSEDGDGNTRPSIPARIKRDELVFYLSPQS